MIQQRNSVMSLHLMMYLSDCSSGYTQRQAQDGVTVNVDHSTVGVIGDTRVDACHNIYPILCRDKSDNSMSMFYIDNTSKAQKVSFRSIKIFVLLLQLDKY